MRKSNWQTCFWREVQNQSRQAFEYGTRDCVLSAARVADAITENGQYEERAKQAFSWTNEREAVRLTAAGLQSLVESVLGEMIPWPKLNMGDLALIEDDAGRECLAVHDGVQIISPNATGWRSIPFRCVKGGWRVD